ncbi:arsenate reductase/protein-tyrosine-phosphatase family protein [Catellatospora coxensis]|uniref:arsenate reductase/protein-tyrosine-phosphatase family protein n=1 Tax=Catellatospora coxensis TaxID=310354 RepID=UPI001EF2F4D5|nr:ArsR family transcriptional regulator [Catellatospora coxensis]
MALPARTQTPAFLRVAGHPLRWQLLTELAAGDRRVQELTTLLHQPQNLVSYHLAQLRAAGLVTGRRSSADGRDTYYRLDLARCATHLTATGGALHPALGLTPPTTPTVTASGQVLFLCTGNSSRSQMAEALLRHRTSGSVTVFSAGSQPKPVQPHAIAVMAAHGIDMSTAQPKHLDVFTGTHFDHVITVCDRIRETRPQLPARHTAHWSIPDPARDPDGYPAFERVAAELAERVGFLIHTLTQPQPPEAP